MRHTFPHAPQQCRIILWIVSFKCLWGSDIQTLGTALYSHLAHSEEGNNTFISTEPAEDSRLQTASNLNLLHLLLVWSWAERQCNMFIVTLCVQVDTMEMMRHPEETTNMRRQTVSSYFRVGVFYFLPLFCLTVLCVLWRTFLFRNVLWTVSNAEKTSRLCSPQCLVFGKWPHRQQEPKSNWWCVLILILILIFVVIPKINLRYPSKSNVKHKIYNLIYYCTLQVQ